MPTSSSTPQPDAARGRAHSIPSRASSTARGGRCRWSAPTPRATARSSPRTRCRQERSASWRWAAGALGVGVVFCPRLPRVRGLSPAPLRGPRARIRGDGVHDDGGGVQWHDGRRQLSGRPRRPAGRRPPGRVSRAARLAAPLPLGGAARDARDAPDDAGGRPVSDASGGHPVARRTAAPARGRRAARAGRARVQRPGGAGTPQGAGGTVTGHRIGGRNPVEVGLVAIFLLCAGPTVRLSAQVPDTTPPPLVTTGALVVGTDTTHRIRPIGAFLRSLLVPGWGQAATGRHVTGALFATCEGVAAMMTLKAQSEMHYLKETNSANLTAKRQEVQD